MVIVSEISKRSDKLGALVAALPLVTLLVLFWMHFEGTDKLIIDSIINLSVPHSSISYLQIVKN